MSATLNSMSLYPDKGVYAPGDPVCLNLDLQAEQETELKLTLRIYHLEQQVAEMARTCSLTPEFNHIQWSWTPPQNAPAGYGVELVELGLYTAFDVLPAWTVFPRYGFVCDFSPHRRDTASTVENLAKFHLNGLQFYDWQYRHDDLVPPCDEFIDPLGRRLSLEVTRQFIRAAHEHGMAAMPYLAIYAASAPFWRAHPEWALYDSDGKPVPFGEDFLGIMNPAPGGGWQQHLLNQCGHVLSLLPFDGLHIDQYGQPKTGLDACRAAVNLPAAFADMVRRCAQSWPDKPTVFNAVGNWPIEALAAAPVAFVYIEIWPPDTGYPDVVRIVRNARRLSGGKPVVIALYLPADRPANILLADALIYSAGGSRIELGERERLLADPYFPKHQELSREFKDQLRRYTEFAIRYEEWIGPFLPDGEISLQLPEDMPGFCRRTANGYGISLVNLAGVDPVQWDRPHPSPLRRQDVQIRARVPSTVKAVWAASPENSAPAVPLKFSQTQDEVCIQIPEVQTWCAVHIRC